METSDAILARLSALHPRVIDLSLGRIEKLLESLGNPQRNLPPVIHVAGTNGKGSTIAFMRAMLESQGKSVHVYTSPHLVRFHERIRLAGRLVDEATLGATLDEVERVNAGAPVTLFEITTAAAFLLFSRVPADALLLEVGLGGRLDATNVVERPAATVITPVSQDHAGFLGEGVGRIAAEKAGILRRGAPAVVAAQTDEGRAVIERAAARAGAPLHISGQDWHAREERGRLIYEDEAVLLDLPLPRLAGRHQLENAGAAIAALRAVPALGVTQAAMEKGLTSADWPARLQRLTRGRLAEILPAGIELWLDGGHNPDGARVVAEAMAALEERAPCPLTLVVGMLDTKDSNGLLAPYASIANALHAVPVVSSASGLAPMAVMEAARLAGIPSRAHASLDDALGAILQESEGAARILITGSLYLAGEVLALNETPPE